LTGASVRLRPLSGPIVVDASVVVEYLVRLTYTRQAAALFTMTIEDSPVELWAPDLLFAECASALRKLVLRKAITPRDGLRSIVRLARLPISAVGTADFLSEAWGLRERMTPYDACYVVLARRLETLLVTADSRLARTLARSRDDVVLLSDLA